MSEKKVVRRNVAIALGIVCILLIAGIGGAMAYYSMVINDKNTAYDTYASSHSHTNSGFNTLNETYQDYFGTHSHTNSEYDSLNITYQNYVATHSHTNAEYDAYVANHHYTDAEYNSLNATYQDYMTSHHHTDAEYNNLSDIVNLAKSTVWVDDQTISQPAHSYTPWTVSASYAGYVSVWVQTSTTTNTYVRVIWSAYGINYDQQITVGTGGTAVFPILPCSNIEIRVGNVNLLTGATETVTITYHY
jgi:hypothetical protein